jgi:hypothetical protein
MGHNEIAKFVSGRSWMRDVPIPDGTVLRRFLLEHGLSASDKEGFPPVANLSQKLANG